MTALFLGLTTIASSCSLPDIPAAAAGAMVNGSITRYNEMIAGEKTDLLLWNIARVYHRSPPHFVQTQQVNTQFTAEISGAVGATYGTGTGAYDWSFPFGVGAKGVVAPTITVNPIQGTALAEYLLRPVPHYSVLLWIWHPHEPQDAEDTIRLATAEFLAVEASRRRDAVTAAWDGRPWVVRNRHAEQPLEGRPFPRSFPEMVEFLAAERTAQRLRIVAIERTALATGKDEARFGHFALTNVDDGMLTEELKSRMSAEMADDPFQASLIPVILQDASGDLLVRGYLRLRNPYDVLHFVADDIRSRDGQSQPGDRICPLQIRRTPTSGEGATLAVDVGSDCFWIDDADDRSKSAFNTLFLLLEANLGDPKGLLPVLTLPVGRL